ADKCSAATQRHSHDAWPRSISTEAFAVDNNLDMQLSADATRLTKSAGSATFRFPRDIVSSFAIIDHLCLGSSDFPFDFFKLRGRRDAGVESFGCKIQALACKIQPDFSHPVFLPYHFGM